MSDLPHAIPIVGSNPQNKISCVLYKAKLFSFPTLNSEETGVLMCCLLPKGTEELDPFIRRSLLWRLHPMPPSQTLIKEPKW